MSEWNVTFDTNWKTFAITHSCLQFIHRKKNNITDEGTYQYISDETKEIGTVDFLEGKYVTQRCWFCKSEIPKDVWENTKTMNIINGSILDF